MTSRGYLALTVIGVLVALAGLALIALDSLGKGDTSGLDLKDVGLVIVGLVLAIAGGALGARKPAPTPPP